MKKCFVVPVLSLAVCASASAQSKILDSSKVVVDNDQIKVIEYYAEKGGDVCGKGQHTHAPHLTVMFTAADVLLTVDGKSRRVQLPSEGTFWSGADTHIAVNASEKPVKLLIIEPK